MYRVLPAAVVALGLLYAMPAGAQQPAQPEDKATFEGTMSLEKMGAIVSRLDEAAEQPTPGVWRFAVEGSKVMIVTDARAGRMRIIVPVARVEQMTSQDLLRIAQANFDSALDSRYAIARNVLWSVYIHPLHELHERQFITAIGQTVNLAQTYGTTYMSGALTFGGGDSRAIIRRQLIDRLIKKGLPI